MSNPTSVRYEERDEYDSQTDSDQLGSFGDGGMEGRETELFLHFSMNIYFVQITILALLK